MENRLLIYSTFQHPRLQYIVQELIGEYLGLSPVFSNDWESFLKSDLPKLNHSNRPFHGISVPLTVHDSKWGESPNAGQDIFQGSFYKLSRVEEYGATAKDMHGRFQPGTDDYSKPWINIWLAELRRQLLEQYPGLPLRTQKFTILSTVDIDAAWCYRNKGWQRQAGGLLRDMASLHFNHIKDRFKAIFTGSDPYDIFSWLLQFHKETKVPLRFFWLLADLGSHDKNIQWNHPAQRKLIAEISNDYPIGLHPSYYSYEQPVLVQKEQLRLQSILNKDVTTSRQHYLRMSLPHTYRTLLEAGIKEDYTMGFADRPGFRAGICTPFKWYDLEREQATNLTIVPFAWMDVALKNYMKLSPEEGLKVMEQYRSEVQAVNGHLVSIWHNESLSNYQAWKGWRALYTNMYRGQMHR